MVDKIVLDMAIKVTNTMFHYYLHPSHHHKIFPRSRAWIFMVFLKVIQRFI
jgi:hypothetical protein